MTANSCNPSTLEAGAQLLRVQSQPGIHSEFKAHLGYIYPSGLNITISLSVLGTEVQDKGVERAMRPLRRILFPRMASKHRAKAKVLPEQGLLLKTITLTGLRPLINDLSLPNYTRKDSVSHPEGYG